MSVIIRRTGREMIVPAGVPEFLVNGLGAIMPAGPRYATFYLFREEPGLNGFFGVAPQEVAAVKVTLPYVAIPPAVDMTMTALAAAGIDPDEAMRKLGLMH